MLSVHKSVLLNEVLKYLDLKPGQNVIDGTVGGGGHAEAMLERIGLEGRLLGIDADEGALERAEIHFKKF